MSRDDGWIKPGMTRDDKFWTWIAVLAFLVGASGGILGGMFIDRGREPALVEIMQFVEGDKFDLETHGPVYQTTPPRVMEDSGRKP